MDINKGQWFIISAVIISGSFLFISLTFSSYFTVDSSKIAMRQEDFIFNNIKDQLKETIKLSADSILQRNMLVMVYEAQKLGAELGYNVNIKYCTSDTDITCIAPATSCTKSVCWLYLELSSGIFNLTDTFNAV